MVLGFWVHGQASKYMLCMDLSTITEHLHVQSQENGIKSKLQMGNDSSGCPSSEGSGITRIRGG